MKAISSERNTVQSVNRALMILKHLKKDPNGLGVTELSLKLDVAKSTTHRLLQSLLSEGFVKKDNITDKYQLGLTLIELGNQVLDSLDIRKVSKVPLEKLVSKMDETAHLGIYEKGEIVYIDKIESSLMLRMYSQIGKRAPFHCTGIGKAIIAHLPEKEDIINSNDLYRFTEYTITDNKEIKEELNNIKRLGYSIDNQEHEIGIRCAAAPIFNSYGEVVAGISIAGPETRMTDEKIEECVKEVKKYANIISAELGYY